MHRKRSLWLFAGMTAVLIGTASPGALGEMKVLLRDGRILTLPVESKDIDTITFGEPAQGRRSPAARAAAARNRSPGRPTVRSRFPTKPRVLSVGPGKRYARPSDAAKAARHGDVIEIQAGVYNGDVAVWRADNLIIRGVGGRPHLKAQGMAAQRKAIWVIKGNNTTVENIEFSGCRVRDLNGAGIRQQGVNLTVRRSYFHGNEIGILGGSNRNSNILIEHSEFSHNTIDYDRYEREGRRVNRSRTPGHNIYIGRVRSFTLRYSYVHHATIGHNVKSRARTNLILYNRLMDEGDGRSSYIIDLPNGGDSYLIGNLLQQSRNTENSSMVNYGSRGNNPRQELYVVNNTFVNQRGNGIYLRRKSDGPMVVINNIFSGGGMLATTAGTIRSNLIVEPKSVGKRLQNLIFGRGKNISEDNLIVPDAGFIDPASYDYRLAAQSPAIDAGADPGKAGGRSLLPVWSYRHPSAADARKTKGKIDIGAYEFGG